MKTATVLCAALTAGLFALPAFAADSMSMSKGEGMMIMSDGKMATMPSLDDKASMMMMKHPMKGCVVMMMGKDGKMYMTTETDKMCAAASKM